MALPTYDKTKRKKSFERLPKGAYVIVIKDAKEEDNSSGKGTHLTICFDIAEGEYKGYFQSMMENSSSEDKKWPFDARFYVTVPDDNSKEFIWDKYNTFFADLEDSNGGFVFSGDLKKLKGKLLGGKFYIEQSEFNGKIYDHTRMKWTCVADDVRNGKSGRLPEDKLITSKSNLKEDANGFVSVPEGTDEDVPW